MKSYIQNSLESLAGNVESSVTFEKVWSQYKREEKATKTPKMRIGTMVGACVLVLSLIPAVFYFAPTAYAAMQSWFTQSFSIPLSAWNDQKVLNSIFYKQDTPLLSDLGNPSPAQQPVPPDQVPTKLRGVTGPFSVSVPNGHAALITMVPTLKGGISVEGNFKEGGYIICRNENNGQTYTGHIITGTASKNSDYIATPPGTYVLYMASGKSTNAIQSYSSLIVNFN